MAQNCGSTVSNGITFGTSLSIAGDVMTAVITIRTTSTLSGAGVFGQWGKGSDQSYLLQHLGSGALGFVVEGGGSAKFGRQTSAGAISTNSTHRIVCEYDRNGGTPFINIYVDNSAQSVTPWLASNNIVIANSTSKIFIGASSDWAATPLNVDSAEHAVYNSLVSSKFIEAYSNGASPSFYPHGRQLYFPAWTTNDNVERQAGRTVSRTGVSDALHPQVFYHYPAQYSPGITAVAGSPWYYYAQHH